MGCLSFLTFLQLCPLMMGSWMCGFYSGRSGEGTELFAACGRNLHRNSRMAASHLIHVFIQHVFIEQHPMTVSRSSGFIHSHWADIC